MKTASSPVLRAQESSTLSEPSQTTSTRKWCSGRRYSKHNSHSSRSCFYYSVWQCLNCLFVTLFSQCQALKGVERAPYTGDVAAVQNSGKKEVGPLDGDMNPRPCTRHGGMRDLHESSFSFSGTVVYIKSNEKSTILDTKTDTHTHKQQMEEAREAAPLQKIGWEYKIIVQK